MPWRILQVVEATTAGVKKHVLSLVRTLDRNRFDVMVACPRVRSHAYGDESFLSELQSMGVRAAVIPMQRPLNLWADVQAVWHLGALLRAQPFDVIHLHSSKAGLLGRLAAMLYQVRAPIVYTPNAFAFQAHSGLRRHVYLLAERFLCRRTDMLVCVSAGEKALALSERLIAPERLALIENAIDPGPQPTLADRQAARAVLGLPSDAPVVGMVGRLTRQKGHRYLLAAVPTMRRRLPTMQVVLLGNGEERNHLEAQAAALGIGDCVHFVGYRPDATRLMAAFDCLALPSLWEGLSYALLEAYAAGVPVVGTRVPGLEVIQDGETGLTVPPADVPALAEAVVRILTDAALRARLAAAGRELVCRRFHLREQVKQVEQLYEMLALGRSIPLSAVMDRQALPRPPAPQVGEGRR